MNSKQNGENLEYQIKHLLDQEIEAENSEEYEKAAALKEQRMQLERQLQTTRAKWSNENNRFVDEDSAKDDVDIEIGRHNFVRAVMLAQQHGYTHDKIRNLQVLAIKQYACEYRNLQGLNILIQEYGFSKAETRRILEEGFEEYGGYTGAQYDINTTSNTTLLEWIKNFQNSK